MSRARALLCGCALPDRKPRTAGVVGDDARLIAVFSVKANRLSLLRPMRYIGAELLLVIGTSSWKRCFRN